VVSVTDPYGHILGLESLKVTFPLKTTIKASTLMVLESTVDEFIVILRGRITFKLSF
jgi:hypothetical protein